MGLNFAFGKVAYCNAGLTTGWQYNFNLVCPGDPNEVPFWIERLLESQNFKRAVRSRWDSLRMTEFSDAAIEARINNAVAIINEGNAIARNSNIWNSDLAPWGVVSFSTHQEELQYLKSYISDRLAWLDEEFAAF